MPIGNRSNSPGAGPFVQRPDADFAVDTPDGVHLTMFTNAMFAGPIDLGPYRLGPAGPVMHEGAMNDHSYLGNRSGRSRTVTVK